MCPTNPQKDLKGGRGNEHFSRTASERLSFWIFTSRFTAVIYAMRYALCEVLYDLRLVLCGGLGKIEWVSNVFTIRIQQSLPTGRQAQSAFGMHLNN
jgi:hypothetical protein